MGGGQELLEPPGMSGWPHSVWQGNMRKSVHEAVAVAAVMPMRNVSINWCARPVWAHEPPAMMKCIMVKHTTEEFPLIPPHASCMLVVRVALPFQPIPEWICCDTIA